MNIRRACVCPILASLIFQAAIMPAQDAPEVLDEVVVTGTSTPRGLKETAVRTQVFGQEEIQQVHAATIGEALDYNPGLRMEATCQNCSAPEVQMLGLQQRYISILADGIPNFTGLAGVYGLDQIPTALVERIEIVKGGGSLLYGPNAVAGVINIIPHEPEISGGEINLSYENLDNQLAPGQPTGSAVFHFVNHDAGLGLSLHGMRGYSAAVDMNGDNFSDIARRDLWAGGLRTWWHLDDSAKLTLDYLITSEDRRGGSHELDTPPNHVLIAEEIQTRRQVLTLGWSHEISETLDYRLSYSLSDVARESYYGGEATLGSGNPASPFFDPAWTPELGFGTTNNRLHLLDSAINFKPHEGHILTLGLQYRNEIIEDTQASLGRALNDRYENLGVMIQHDWTPSEQWNFVYGTRADFHSELENPVLSPRLAAKYSPTERFRVRAGLSTGFRAPETFDEDLHINNVGGKLQSITLASSLREERSMTLSLAPEWEVNKRVRLELNLYHTWLRNTFVNVETDDLATPNVLEFTKRNGGASAVYGGELAMFLDFQPFTLDLSYTEQRGYFDETQTLLGTGAPGDNLILSDRYPRLPDRFGVVRMGHDFGWCQAFVAARLTGPMLVPHIVTDSNGIQVRNELNRTRSFLTVDFSLTKKFQLRGTRALTTSLGVKNLFNDFQDDLDRGPFHDSTYIYGPRQPRMLYVGMKFEF
jgi:outer membrane receptor for ferrienterochelin and colicins